MKEFKDKVAVITGAASGIGLGIARRAAKEGMKVVVADIEKDALEKTREELKESGTDVISVLADVSKSENIENLAKKTIDAFGEVHLLCNNAGVAAPGPLWESILSDFSWVIGVNLWGVIHGIRTFIPIMLQQDNECHIVNTSSINGILPGDPFIAIYSITKHGIVSLSESLRASFAQNKAKIGISVFCPALVNTRIADSERNRPAEFRGEEYMPSMDRFIHNHPKVENFVRGFEKLWEKGSPADQSGDIVFEAIKNNIFYIFTAIGLVWKKGMKSRFDRILDDYNKCKLIIKDLKSI